MSARAGWLATRWDRLNAAERVGGIDLARGLAVLGMLAAHLLAIDDVFDVTDPSTWLAVVNGRSSILFATLAGVSIGLVTGGREPVQGDVRSVMRLRLVVRAFLLWLIGAALILTTVPVYVILPAYALLFLLATLLIGFRARALFLIAAGLAVVMPLIQPLLDGLPLWTARGGEEFSHFIGWNYPFPVWIAFVAAGMGLARAGIRSLAVQLWTLAAASFVAIFFYALDALTQADPATPYWGEVWTAFPHSSGILEVWASGAFALAVIAACLLVCRTVLTWVVLPLRAVGSMPLTAYAAQIFVWAIIARMLVGDVGDLFSFRELDPFWPFVLWTIAGCTAWTLLVGRGPLEWFVDRAARFAAPGR